MIELTQGASPRRPTDDIGGAAPLTFQQAFYEQIHRGGDDLKRLDTFFSLRISGPLELGALAMSFDTLALRHDSLRTRIFAEGGVLRQVVGRAPERALSIVHLPAGAGITSDAVPHILELANRVFDFEGEMLFDATLVRLSAGEAVLFWGMHHFICDHVTRRQLLRELWDLYTRFVLGGGAQPHDHPMQYWEYCAWQRDAYRKWQDTKKSFWQQYLSGASGIRWPDRKEIDAERREVEKVCLIFPPSLSDRLRDLARRKQLWLSVMMLSIYVATVSRWCDQRDVVIATTVTGRDRPEHQSMAGFLAHPMYLRVQLTGNETFLDLLAIVSREFHSGLFRKDFGGVVMETPNLLAGTLFQWFPLLGESLIPTGDASTSLGLSVNGFTVAQTEYLPRGYDLMFVLADLPQGIFAIAGYRQGVFPTESVQRFLDTLQGTANRLAESPSASIWSSGS